MQVSLLSSLSLLTITIPTLTTAYKPPNLRYTCTPFTVPITVTNITTLVPFLPPITTQSQATSYANLLTTRGAPQPAANLTTLTATYNITGQHCRPHHQTSNSSTLHILTHGFGFNSSYWDLYLPGNNTSATNSYTSFATSHGYSTLSYNRLGTAPSTLANPYTEVQPLVELAILTELTKLAWSGGIPALTHKPAHVVQVAHSYGSGLVVGLAATAPQLVSGVVLTGFSNDLSSGALFLAASGLRIASHQHPDRFPGGKYQGGYLTWPDKWANQYAFLSYPYFDGGILDFAEATKQPFAIGELIAGGLLPGKAPGFKGPVLYWDGQGDLIFCGGNCTGLVDEGMARGVFGGSGDVSVLVQQGSGHAVNLHVNAAKAFEGILAWVGERFGQ